MHYVLVYLLGEKMGRIGHNKWYTLIKVTSYDWVLSYPFSLLEDIFILKGSNNGASGRTIAHL